MLSEELNILTKNIAARKAVLLAEIPTNIHSCEASAVEYQ